MKKHLIAFLLLYTVIPPLQSFAASDTTKYALVIAISDYPTEGGWKDISSVNDIALIKGALKYQGFKEENITVIVDGQAKKNLIIDAFSRLSNIVKPGDIVVVHFSGHGQQIEDDNDDEFDGWDESLVPWDAKLRPDNGYTGQNHLRDDEIQVLTDNLRKKLGPDGNLLLILDACHSGTANRGLSVSRGTDIKFSKKGYSPQSRGIAKNEFQESDETNKQMAPMVTLSGAGQHQLNYEYYDKEKDSSYGSLSYAFSKAIVKSGKHTTYRSLFDMIKVNMSTIAPAQSPQVEGDLDQELFGGKVLENKPYFMVTQFRDPENVSINAGSIIGIYKDSEVAFYPNGTYNPADAEPIATGTIVYSKAVESDVKLDNPVEEDQIKNSWIYITRQNFGDNNLNVKLDIRGNNDLKHLLSDELAHMPKIIVTDNNYDLLIEMNNEFTRGNKLQLITSDELTLFGTEIGAGISNERLVKQIVNAITSYMQVNLLKKLDVHDRNINIDIQLLPVTITYKNGMYQVDSVLDINEFRNGNGELEFTNNDYFVLSLENKGYKRAYFQVLDIRPDNTVGLLYPSVDDNRPASEFSLDLGEKKELRSTIFYFEPPYGNEYIKLIATEEPIDLRFIVSTRGEADTKGNGHLSPMEELLKNSFKGTRAGALKASPTSASVKTIPVKVVAERSLPAQNK